MHSCICPMAAGPITTCRQSRKPERIVMIPSLLDGLSKQWPFYPKRHCMPPRILVVSVWWKPGSVLKLFYWVLGWWMDSTFKMGWTNVGELLQAYLPAQHFQIAWFLRRLPPCHKTMQYPTHPIYTVLPCFFCRTCTLTSDVVPAVKKQNRKTEQYDEFRWNQSSLFSLAVYTLALKDTCRINRTLQHKHTASRKHSSGYEIISQTMLHFRRRKAVPPRKASAGNDNHLWWSESDFWAVRLICPGGI